LTTRLLHPATEEAVEIPASLLRLLLRLTALKEEPLFHALDEIAPSEVLPLPALA
jgi:hypothetical protein